MKKKYPEGSYDGGSKGLFSKVRHGYGKMRFYRSGSYDGSGCALYEGEWQDDKISGRGRMTYANGGKYEGEFKDGRRFGKGTYSDIHGNKIEYESQEGSHGKGKMTYSGGSYYIGEFVGDKKDGKGVEYDQGGELVFEGSFRSGLRSYGTFYNRKEGYVYEGGFYGDKIHGKGKIQYSDGTVYEGTYYAGELKGELKVILPDGTVTSKDYSKGTKKTGEDETTDSFVSRVAEALNLVNATDEEKKAILDVAKETHRGAAQARAHAEESGKKHYLKDAVRLSTPRQEADIAKKCAEKAREIAGRCDAHIITDKLGRGTYQGETKNGKIHGYGVFTSENGEVAGLFKDGKQESVVVTNVNGGSFAGYCAPDTKFELGVRAFADIKIEACSYGAVYDGVGEIVFNRDRIFRGYIKGTLDKIYLFLDGICTYGNGSIAYETVQLAQDESATWNKTVKIKYADGSVRYGKYDGTKHDGYCIDEENGKFRFMLYKDGELVKNFKDIAKDK